MDKCINRRNALYALGLVSLKTLSSTESGIRDDEGCRTLESSYDIGIYTSGNVEPDSGLKIVRHLEDELQSLDLDIQYKGEVERPEDWLNKYWGRNGGREVSENPAKYSNLLLRTQNDRRYISRILDSIYGEVLGAAEWDPKCNQPNAESTKASAVNHFKPQDLEPVLEKERIPQYQISEDGRITRHREMNSIITLKHELGHNLGLKHSGKVELIEESSQIEVPVMMAGYEFPQINKILRSQEQKLDIHYRTSFSQEEMKKIRSNLNL